MSTEEIVKRLRTVDEESCFSVPCTVTTFCEQAADRLEALEAENKRLREVVWHLWNVGVTVCDGEAVMVATKDWRRLVDVAHDARAALRGET